MSVTIIMYRIKNIQENKNMLFDNFTSLLGSNIIYNYENTQPISLNADIVIRVPVTEVMQSDQAYFINYVRIRRPRADYFYFVRSIKRLSNETLEFSLHIDVLNTFSLYVKSMNEKTLTIREHRNRFNDYTLASGTIYKIVDDISEGITPTLYKGNGNYQTSLGYVDDTANDISGSCYLIYKSKNELSDTDASNPVACYLCFDERLKYADSSTASVTTWERNDLASGSYYYVENEDSGEFIVDEGSGSRIFTNGTCGLGVFFIDPASTNFIKMISMNKTNTVSNYWYDTRNTQYDESITFTRIKGVRVLDILTNDYAKIETGALIDINSGLTGAKYVSEFSRVSNWDSKLIKIIKLPYAPNKITKDSTTGVYDFGSNWQYENGLLRLKDLHTTFKNSRSSTIVAPLAFTLPTGSVINSTRFIKDPKLLHSDFHLEKFIYDNFSYTINLEKCRVINNNPNLNYQIVFKPSNTINSNFLFAIYLNDKSVTQKVTEDYPVILSSRNNEMPIFNNSYINYIKNGFNYDKKSKSIQSASNWSGVALSALSAGVGALLAANPATAAYGALMTVGSAVSLVNSAKNAITTDIQNENNLQSKLATLKAQSTGVSGTDDIDLLTEYSFNKLLYRVYNPSEKIQDMLDNLFYYYGYNTNVYKKPEFSSRVWFNFIQCEPVFDGNISGGVTPPLEFVDEIIEKCKNGFTVYHTQIVNGVATMDINQVYENYESFIL